MLVRKCACSRKHISTHQSTLLSWLSLHRMSAQWGCALEVNWITSFLRLKTDTHRRTQAFERGCRHVCRTSKPEIYKTPVQLPLVGKWEYCIFGHKNIVWRNRRRRFRVASGTLDQLPQLSCKLRMCCEDKAVGWKVVLKRDSQCVLKDMCPSLLLALLMLKRKLQERLLRGCGQCRAHCLHPEVGWDLPYKCCTAHFPQCLRRTSVTSNSRLRICCGDVVPESYVVVFWAWLVPIPLGILSCEMWWLGDLGQNVAAFNWTVHVAKRHPNGRAGSSVLRKWAVGIS